MRNRRYLRKFQPFQTGHVITEAPDNGEDYKDIPCAKVEAERCNVSENDPPVQHGPVVNGYNYVEDGKVGQDDEGQSGGHRGVERSQWRDKQNVPDVPSPHPTDAGLPMNVEQQTEYVPDSVPPGGSPSLRRSSRVGRGQTTKFDDFDLS